MIGILIENPLLLLFVVAAIGYPLGRISIGGSSLGVAAVLFVGLAIGALHPDLKLPELVYQLGLVVFVYTIGLSSGRLFFTSFRRKGLRDNLFALGILIFATGTTLAAGRALGLAGTITAGLYTGSLTNTAALAAVVEYVKSFAPTDTLEQVLAEPVVGFSITYPMGVIGVILAIQLMRRFWKIDYVHESERMASLGATSQRLHNRTILVTRPDAVGRSIEELTREHHWQVAFGRVRHAGALAIATGATRFEHGDLLSVVGPLDQIDQVMAALGEASDAHLEFDRSELDYRGIFVSNPGLAGHRLSDIHLPQQFGAFVTRIRRGDGGMLAQAETVRELGDRVRLVARRPDMDAVSKFFGDSYRALSEVDILTLNLGLAVGLLIGMIPLPLPGGIIIKLGFAGGPLVVSLILGALERTGPLVWNIPYSANLTLRQIGLILFLAGIGTRSGYAFVSTLREGGGGMIFMAGATITFATTMLSLWVGYKLLHIPMSLLIGMVAGIQTQPAVLGFALEQTGDELPNIGYAAVYPVALISKILFAQLLLALLR